MGANQNGHWRGNARFFMFPVHSEGLLSFCLIFKIITTAGNGYGFLIPIVINRTGCANYCLTIIHYMLGSNQATRLPNRKQGSGSKIGNWQTLLFFYLVILFDWPKKGFYEIHLLESRKQNMFCMSGSPQNYI